MRSSGQSDPITMSIGHWKLAPDTVGGGPRRRCSIASHAAAGRRRTVSAPQAVVSLTVLAAALAVLLAVVRLIGGTEWPWLWVLSPLWGLFASVLAATTAFGVVALRASAARPGEGTGPTGGD